MDRSQLRLALLKISLIILLGSSWVFWSYVLVSRPEETQMDALGALMRLPAAIPTQLPAQLPQVFRPPPKGPMIQMKAVEVECWDRIREPLNTTSQWIRLVGRPCQADVPSDRIEVTNLTNGYTGTVFLGSNGRFTTDYLPLDAGENRIQLRFQPEGFAYSAELLVHR